MSDHGDYRDEMELNELSDGDLELLLSGREPHELGNEELVEFLGEVKAVYLTGPAKRTARAHVAALVDAAEHCRSGVGATWGAGTDLEATTGFAEKAPGPAQRRGGARDPPRPCRARRGRREPPGGRSRSVRWVRYPAAEPGEGRLGQGRHPFDRA